MINKLWWVNPAGLLVFLILPLFVLSAIVGAPLMPQFGSVDFLTPATIALGAGCICAMAIGAVVGSTAMNRLDMRAMTFDQRRFDQLLVAMLWLSVVAHLIYLGPILSSPTIMWAVLSGQKGGIFLAKAALTRLVGITSLTNITPLAFCMCSVRFVTCGKLLPSSTAAAAFVILLPLIVIHAFVGGERLVLVENGVGLLLPIFTFLPRLRTVGQFVPVGGLVAFLIIFALGEYTRSWPYYHDYYDSFAQFAGLRLLAYIAGASNTGAGMVVTMPPVGFPFITAGWLTRIPAILSIDTSYTDQYFTRFGNFEFNNPSGVFAATVDFGVALGFLYLFAFGLLVGLIYGAYRRAHPIGLLCYPLFYIGIAILTQAWYWGDSRFLPELLSLAIVIGVTVRRRVLIQPA